MSLVDPSNLLNWYKRLWSRTVDLVGDFLGSELFIIDGDSLLLECFSNEKLDFYPGFQLLHATYIVEKFLQKLQQRKCVFEIVFFDSNAQFCIPTGSSDNNDNNGDDRYLLAREAIIQHLIAISEEEKHGFNIHVFETFQSESFGEHFVDSGAYVFMCHEGTMHEINEIDEVTDDDADSSSDYSQEDSGDDIHAKNETEIIHLRRSRSVIGFRLMIHWFVTHGCNIALINNLEFRDTKIMAMVIQDSAKRQGGSLSVHDILWADISDTTQSTNSDGFTPMAISKLLEMVIQEDPDLTQSQCLLTVSLAVMKKAGPNNLTNTIGLTSAILHLVILQHAKLEDRVMPAPNVANTAFFDAFLKTSKDVLTSTCWMDAMQQHKLPCDLADFADGRMFFQVQAMIIESLGISRVISSTTLSPFNKLASLVDRLCGTKLAIGEIKDDTPGILSIGKHSDSKPGKELITEIYCESPNFVKVLPFQNSVFDEHLKPVHLEIEASVNENEVSTAKKFMDLNHWHNLRPLDQKKAVLTPLNSRQQRRDQLYMAEMRHYAESLLGSVGMSQTETIVVDRSSSSHKKPSLSKEKQPSNRVNKHNGPAKGPTVREKAAAAVQQIAAEREQRKRNQWVVNIQEFSKLDDSMVRFTRVEDYLSGLSKDDRRIVEAEIFTYLLDTLVQAICEMNGSEQDGRTLLATHIWSVITRLMKVRQGISADISKYVSKMCQQLALPPVQLEPQVDHPLSFKLSKEISKAPQIMAGTDPVEFQLLYGGPFMDRSIDSLPDPRTPDFNPDRWQRDVLDQIDQKKSTFIVAPTSAGKTFISFYAMKQILKEDDDGVLVYVAPTKALVNQIAAEVMARFSKSYPENATAKSVWAIHTRDHRINNPLTCQILITVPHILQIMLLAPSNANTWTPRLKRIIFDEIHCIGQVEDGIVWEQLLLLAPCPIIALSATVGNPNEFNSWLQRAQDTNGHDLKMIQYNHRYSDLRKYVYHPPRNFIFEGFSKLSGLSHLGLDEADGMELMHPVLSLADRSRRIPDDFSLEPRDCLTLWKAMNDLQTPDFPIDTSLNPFNRFSGTMIQKKHIIEWQKPLKDLLGKWIKDRKSPFEALLHRLSRPDRTNFASVATDQAGLDNSETPSTSESSGLFSSTLPLICSMQAQSALPALFFNYDRSQCEGICYQVLTQLQEAEKNWKATSSKWKSDMDKWNEWRKQESKTKNQKTTKATKGQKGGDGDPMSRADQIRESASVEKSQWVLFDPERPVEMFSLADFKKLRPSEFAVYAEQLKRREMPKWLIDALERGIGVHHAGMNRKYRQICEVLFRKGFLRVVIATGTLALGINMPCKTVVFSGDSVFLTALNFRQAAGRAGRRGFDILGNVVFQHIPTAKVLRLVSSRLPDLNGHFPITTSLVLRLFILLHGSGHSASAIRSINSILSQPRICLGGPEMKQTVLHYLRFSIEYLRRNFLLDDTGAPLNFAGCISHLYYTESSSFAFHALLISGYFDDLCKDIGKEKERPKILYTLMLVMAHIFGRVPLRKSVLESYRSAEKRASSVVVLPPLPEEASKILHSHNSQVLNIYTGYVSTFIDQHVKGYDQSLPFSAVKCGGNKSAVELGLSQVHHQEAPKITSPFYALSGQYDSWDSVSNLCESVRSDVWLEASVVPYVPVASESHPLNAYLLDFFKHGNIKQLETANKIRRGDVWFVLNDFSMVLATITTTLENFLNPKGNDVDMDMLNVGGHGDSKEFETDAMFVDKKVAEMEAAATTQPGDRNRQEKVVPVLGTHSRRAGKGKVAESWEDDLIADVEKVILNQNDSNDKSGAVEPGKEMSQSRKSSLALVYKAFIELKNDFDEKFKAMWA
ncbi:hypothetical protein EYB25_009937 [Talaromyces marneffei]|nr:hypothetical protein EYB25_009937 [Talaromyces marneffei]